MTASTEEGHPRSPVTSEPSKDSPMVIYSPPIDRALANAELKAWERLDEADIVKEIHGQTVDRFFHEMSIRGQQQIQISWQGVKWLALKEGHLTVESVQLSETDDKYRAVAWGYDKVRDVRMMGASEQSKTMLLKDGTRISDEFALAKCTSKAQRNALRALLPETLIVEAYKAWKNRETPTTSPGNLSTKPAATTKLVTQPAWTDTSRSNQT